MYAFPELKFRTDIGQVFSVSHRFEGVSSNSAVEVYASNPEGSGVKVHVIAIECVSMGQAWIDVYSGVTVISNGTELVPRNRNYGSNKQSVCHVEYGGSYDITAARLDHSTVLPGGSRSKVVGDLAEVGEQVTVPPGNNLLVRMTNKAGTTVDMSIRMLWWEED